MARSYVGRGRIAESQRRSQHHRQRVANDYSPVRHQFPCKTCTPPRLTCDFRADVEGAANTGEPLHLPQLVRTRPPLAQTLNWQSSEPYPKPVIVDCLARLRIDHRILDAFNGLADISRTLSNVLGQPGVTIETTSFDEDMLLLLHGLVAASKHIEGKTLDETCQVALLIYGKSLTRALPLGPPSRRLLERLKNVLQNYRAYKPSSKDDQFSSAQMQFQLWLAVMGAITYDPAGENSDWWVRQVRTRADRLNLRGGWEEVKQHMMRVLWVEQIHNVHLEALWNRIDALKTTEKRDEFRDTRCKSLN